MKICTLFLVCETLISVPLTVPLQLCEARPVGLHVLRVEVLEFLFGL
jgi:hypothetical protein